MKFDNISPAEWRWVAILSGIFVAITLIPYAWALSASNDQYAFMGILFNPQDGATYLSKIEQGTEGNWLFEMRHTPQDHDPAGFHLFYLTLGHIARFLGLSNLIVFHLARVAASFFMFASLYQLGASIWTRERPRRLFFWMISVGSGLGWLALIFNPDQLAPDLLVPEAFPLLAAFTNPHFPLAIGCMALIAEHLLTVFRPGYDEAPTMENGGLLLIVLMVVLTIVSPPGSMIIGGTLALFMLARGLRYRKIPLHEARWSAMLILPATPFALYFLAVFRFNEVMSNFNEQNQTPSPNVFLFLFGYGLLLFLALPGFARAVRRFEADGDQLMLCWAIINVLGIYLPGFGLQRRLFIGLIIPIVYFAVRALEDYWFDRVPEKWRNPALIALFVFILPTHVFTFGAPLALTVANREAGAENFLLLEEDYINVFDWLNKNGKTEEVVLASPEVSLWLPARTHMRVFYGHPFETVPARERLREMENFFRGIDCEAVFNPNLDFRVKYILWGVRENEIAIMNSGEIDELKELEEEAGITLSDMEDLGDETYRLPSADRCRQLIEERAIDKQESGNVTLYIFDTP